MRETGERGERRILLSTNEGGLEGVAWSRLKEEEEEEARSIHTHLSSQLVWMDRRRRGKEREGREREWVRE